MNRLLKDLSIDRAQNPALNDRWDSEEEDADDGDDMDIIDRCKSSF